MAPPSPPDQEHPGRHPDPPTDLAVRSLPICHVDPPWFRCHWSHHDPVYFGRSGDNRFDDPRREFGVLYLGADAHCAFVETFGQATGEVVLTSAAIRQRSLTIVGAWRPLKLVDLRGSGLARIGADARLFAGAYGPAQPYSRKLWEHPERPDGIYYPARHDPSRCAIALLDRDDLTFWTHTMPTFDILNDILATYGWAILPDS